MTMVKLQIEYILYQGKRYNWYLTVFRNDYEINRISEAIEIFVLTFQIHQDLTLENSASYLEREKNQIENFLSKRSSDR